MDATDDLDVAADVATAASDLARASHESRHSRQRRPRGLGHDRAALEHWISAEAEEGVQRDQCLPQELCPADVARLVLWSRLRTAGRALAAVDRQRWVDVSPDRRRVVTRSP
jgi:hypothetical protein